MKCPFREGSKGCIWWITGCMHKEAPAEVKQACAGSQRLEREAVCQKVQT